MSEWLLARAKGGDEISLLMIYDMNSPIGPAAMLAEPDLLGELFSDMARPTYRVRTSRIEANFGHDLMAAYQRYNQLVANWKAVEVHRVAMLARYETKINRFYVVLEEFDPVWGVKVPLYWRETDDAFVHFVANPTPFFTFEDAEERALWIAARKPDLVGRVFVKFKEPPK